MIDTDFQGSIKHPHEPMWQLIDAAQVGTGLHISAMAIFCTAALETLMTRYMHERDRSMSWERSRGASFSEVWK